MRCDYNKKTHTGAKCVGYKVWINIKKSHHITIWPFFYFFLRQRKDTGTYAFNLALKSQKPMIWLWYPAGCRLRKTGLVDIVGMQFSLALYQIKRQFVTVQSATFIGIINQMLSEAVRTQPGCRERAFWWSVFYFWEVLSWASSSFARLLTSAHNPSPEISCFWTAQVPVPSCTHCFTNKY